MQRHLPVNRIAWLMILSEFLIAAFAGRWLYAEYRSEKESLQKKLFENFVAAKTRMTDTLLARHVVLPMLRNPERLKIRSLPGQPESPQADSVRIVALQTAIHVIDRDTLNRGNHMAGSSGNTNIDIRLNVPDDTSGELLYKGLRMFITEAAGPKGEHEFFERHLGPADTVLLKSFFAENLERNAFPVRFSWVTNYPRPHSPPPPFYYESKLYDQPYGVVIKNYDRFLLQQMGPRILLALLLVLVTSVAFRISYRSLKAQQRLGLLKDDFIGNITHELKTPVATMKVAIEAMQQMDPSEQKETMREYLGITSQELNRLDQLIQKVMNSLLMEEQQDLFQPQPLNLLDLIQKTISSLQLSLGQQNATVHVNAERAVYPVYADPLHVQNILFNLFDNSMKYGGMNVNISLRLAQNDAQVILYFRDNGPGIPAKYVDQVFEKFFRAPVGNRHGVKGSGLGLSYVFQVMKQLEGTITVKNVSGGGCEFTLAFPKFNEKKTAHSLHV